MMIIDDLPSDETGMYLNTRDHEAVASGSFLTLFSNLYIERRLLRQETPTRFSQIMQEFRGLPYLFTLQNSSNYLDRLMFRYLQKGHYYYAGLYLSISLDINVESKFFEYFQDYLNSHLGISVNRSHIISLPAVPSTFKQLQENVTQVQLETLDNLAFQALKDKKLDRMFYYLGTEQMMMGEDHETCEFLGYVYKSLQRMREEVILSLSQLQNPHKHLFQLLCEDQPAFHIGGFFWLLVKYHDSVFPDESMIATRLFNTLIEKLANFIPSMSVLSFFDN